MSKRKADIEVGRRAYEECDRIFSFRQYGGMLKTCNAIGCNRKTLNGWKDGLTPETFYLIRLHYLGADVMYILTGVRKGNGKLNKINRP